MPAEESIRPLVSIIIITYNQEKFIRKCIESILQQVTEYSLEIVIGDDCSKDTTWQIIDDYVQKYPGIIRANRSAVNLGLIKNYFQTINLCKGKYIAQCAGDDYWNDKFKIQKQAEFLENNTDYGMIHTDSDVLYERSGTIINNYNFKNNWDIPSGNVFESLLFKGIFIKSLTIMVRKQLIDKYLAEEDPYRWSLEDFPLFLFIAKHSKVEYFNFSTGVYRVLDKSVSHHPNLHNRAAFLRGLFDVELYFADKYGCTDKTKEHILKQYNERKIEIGFYDLDRDISKEGYDYLVSNKKLTIRYFLFNLGSKNSVLRFLINKILYIKKLRRILIKVN